MARPDSPVTDEVATELKRVVQRWQQLPLDRALSHAPALLALIRGLADETARCTPDQAGVIPDLGPAALPDQLTVIAYDVCAAGRAADLALVERLADLRRQLA